MFRKRAAEILRCGLKSLNELDAIEEAECLSTTPEVPVAGGKGPLAPCSSEPGSYSLIEPFAIEVLLADFNFSNPL